MKIEWGCGGGSRIGKGYGADPDGVGGHPGPGPKWAGTLKKKNFSKFFFDFFIVFNYFIQILGVLGVPARPIEGRGPRDRNFFNYIFGLPIAS